jgi:hypothetical protein
VRFCGMMYARLLARALLGIGAVPRGLQRVRQELCMS